MIQRSARRSWTRSRASRTAASAAIPRTRKGTNGVSANGVSEFCVFDGGTFWVLPLTYFYLPKRARAYLFPESVKIGYFCSGPISVDPICPQPKDFFDRMGRSHFCLVPRGSSAWTIHLYESFFFGCVPVILSDDFEMPFQD